MSEDRPMTHEERRRLIEAPFRIQVIGPHYGWGGISTRQAYTDANRRYTNYDLDRYSGLDVSDWQLMHR